MRRIHTIRYAALALTMVAMPLAALAANVTLDADVTVTLPSDGSSYTLKSGSTFDQLDVSSGTMAFTGNSGSNVQATITSGDRKTLTNSRNIATTCGDSSSQVIISTGPGDTTVTPSGTCGSGGGGGGTSGGGSSSSSGGGGGGGGGSFAAAPAAKTVDKVSQLKQQIADVQSQIAQKLSGAASPKSAAASLVTKNLKIGDRNDDVTILQELLARDSSIYPEGTISGLFGPATQRAVKRFQAKYGISQLGSVGPQTRAKLQEVFGTPSAPTTTTPSASSAAAPAPVSAVSAGIPSRVLAPGMRDDQVRQLQQLLASDSAIYPEGTASGYYGPATKRAVTAFQLKYGVIASAADTGSGRVGPKTLAKIQEVFGAAGSTITTSTPAASEPAAPAPTTGTTQTQQVQEQIQQAQAKLLQEQIKQLQEKIKSLQK